MSRAPAVSDCGASSSASPGASAPLGMLDPRVRIRDCLGCYGAAHRPQGWRARVETYRHIANAARPSPEYGLPRMTENGSSEDWDGVLADLQQRRDASRAMGGQERLAKHHAAGKLDARARIDHLLDPGSFVELGTMVGGAEAPADAVVMGSGRIDSRPVMVAAEDFTVKAGTISHAANAKRYR